MGFFFIVLNSKSSLLPFLYVGVATPKAYFGDAITESQHQTCQERSSIGLCSSIIRIYSSSLECGFPMPILVTTWIPQSPSNKPLYYFVLLLYEVSSGGLSDDHVGMKIFVTEGVVPNLWDPLNPKNKQDKVVEG